MGEVALCELRRGCALELLLLSAWGNDWPAMSREDLQERRSDAD